MYKPYTKGTSLKQRTAIEALLDLAGDQGMSTREIARALDNLPTKATRRQLYAMLDAKRITMLPVLPSCRAYRWYASQHKPTQQPEPEPEPQPISAQPPSAATEPSDNWPGDDDPMNQRTVAANDWRIDHPTSPASVFELGHHINRSAA